MANRLANLGQSPRSIILGAGRAPGLPGMEAIKAAYDDSASMRRALTGVRTFFMIPSHEAPDRAHIHLAAVDSAAAAGVERIVYSCFLGAARDATFTFARDHWHTEEHIRNTGVDFTSLRRGIAYMDVLPWIVGTDGSIRGPAGDALLWWRVRMSRMWRSS